LTLEGINKTRWTEILLRIDQTLTILKMISKDLQYLSKDMRFLTNRQIVTTDEQIKSESYPKLLFLRDNAEETCLRRYEESEQLWKDIKCCEKSFFKHDKVRGEVFCMNCGMVIVQRTFGQPGRKGGMWIGKRVGWE